MAAKSWESFKVTGKTKSADLLGWMLPLLLLAAAGCSGAKDWHARTQVVRGTLLINGKPAQGAIVTFHPQGDPVDIRHSLPWGKTDDEGNFTLRTYAQGDGAPPGKYDVTLVWSINPSEMGSPDQLAGKFDDVAESPFMVTIEEGQSELAPLELKGASIHRSGRVRPMAPPSEPRSRR